MVVPELFEVREVAAWWFAKRPLYRDMLVAQFSADLPAGDTIKVRNAADGASARAVTAASLIPMFFMVVLRDSAGDQ